MPSAVRPRGFSPELRASLFHFWIFGSTAVSSVYFGIWLSNRGISTDEIGIINAAPVLVMMLINLLIGRIADRASDWKHTIVILALIAGAAPIGLFFVSGVWGIVLIWTLCVVPAFSLAPVVDTATMRMTLRNGTDFGTIRAWGTVGYMLATVVAGPLISILGDDAFVPLFLAFSVVRALLSLQLPRFRAAPGDTAATPAVPTARHLREVLKLWFVLPLIGLALLQSTHGMLGAFGGLLWREQGIDAAIIGILVGSMALSEAAIMFAWRRLNIRISARHLIVFAAAVAVVRWGGMAFAPPLWMLFLLQSLHAITYAVAYFAGLQFIANWTSEDIAAEAQGFAFVLQQGVSIVALVGFGWLAGLFGSGAWLGASAFSILGLLLCLVSLRLQPVHTASDGHPIQRP